MKKKNGLKASMTKVELQDELRKKASALKKLEQGAKIEVALEEVRACSLTMRHGDQLSEVVAVVFKKLQELNFAIDGAAFIITYLPNPNEANVWIGDDHNQSYATSIKLPHYESPSIKDCWLAKESGIDFFTKTYSFEEKNHWFSYAFEHTGIKMLSTELKQWILEQPCLTQSLALANNSMIGLHFHYKKLLKRQEIAILKRFSRVFDQVYIRFLDLEKAEAQAREAQIQLALERVRARTMAMQRSEELADAAFLLFQLVTELGVNAWTSGFQLWDDDRKAVTVWTSTKGALLAPFKIPATEDPLMIHISAAAERGDLFYVEEASGKALEDHYKYMNTLPSLVDLFGKVADAGHALPKFQINHAAFFKYGYLLFITLEACPEAHGIFKRFAAVFEQTYTRFLDLQRAELQARESQIQLALERVRARTMAMQRSNELQDAALLLFQQLKALNLPLIASGFNIWDEDKKSATAWMAIEEIISQPFKISYAEDVFVAVHEAAQNGESLFVFELRGKELETHLQYLRTIPVFKAITEKIFDESHPFPEFQVLHCAFFSQGYLTFITYESVSQGHEIFKRFAKVFEQTYTRFLDLQKAEKQAREAQIEAALERVRSRTMAMQRSEELTDVAAILFQQVKSFGVSQWTCGFGIWEIGDEHFIWYSANADGNISPWTIPLTEHPVFIEFDKSRRRGDEFYFYEKKGEYQASHYQYMIQLPGNDYFRSLWDAGFVFPEFQIDHVVNFSHGNLVFITYEHVPEMHDTFKRFAKVFEQTYTRFLDLKKAEAQGRESMIEAALERVRSRTMAMQRSGELGDAALLLFKLVQELGAPQWTCGYNIWDDDKKALTAWMARDQVILPPFKTPSNENVFLNFYEAAQRGESLYIEELAGEACASHYRYMSSLPVIGEIFRNLPEGITLPTYQIIHIAFFAQGYLMFITYEPVPHLWDIFKRFAKVFEQTYTRFLDLQKVEEQARESQIEAALERVRSRSMGMQNSDELKEVIQVVFQQFVQLNIRIDHTGFVMDYKARDDYHIWVADPRHLPSQVTIPYFDSVYYNRFNEAKEKGMDFFAISLEFEEKNKFYQTLFKYIPGLPEEAREFYFNCPGLAISTVLLENVGLYIENFSAIPYSDEENATLMRFGKVFQQTYTRFLDLQKVEEQARESQIEASLERVRSRSMGMQKSEELRDVIQVIYEQFIHLGFNIDGAGFNVDIRDSDDWNLWMTHRLAMVPTKMQIPYFDHPLANALLQARNNGDQTFTFSLTHEEKNRMMDQVFKYVIASEEEKNALYSTPAYLMSEVLFKDVALFIENYEGRPFSEAENGVLMRFGKAFEQTYIRFNDLKHAEAQVREAKVEAALERARTQSMLMQRSDELNDTLKVFHQQVQLLEINSDFSFLWLPDEENDKHVFWATWTEEKNGSTTLKSKSLTYPLDRNEPFTAECLVDWKGAEPVKTYKVAPANVKSYFAAWGDLLSGVEKLKPEFFPDGLDYVEAFMKYGCFGIVISRLLTEDEKEILRRFSVEFERAYTRFLDLQKAEAQALEAIKRASVDRVRAEIASMRTTNDLERITPLIWNELTILDVPFIRCGVFIMDEEHEQVHTFLSTPEGKAILSFTSAFSSQKIITEALPYWRRKEIFKAHWDEAAFLEQVENLVQHGVVSSSDSYLTENRPKNLFLHFLPFLQGLLYVGNAEPLNEEHLQLVQALADAFSTAYARYEDFNKLELANLKIEKTLVDLKQTQAQLVQSEKMASLGELTAGIAHEIQNPLNFVNNFSEVNKELLAELNDEIEKGNYEEVKIIANDLINNEEKISHHGKRADAIVKGMLQHSRSTSLIKEPTDINKLADEYLRLSYHGLRAKDKLFNAAMKYNFDETIGKINIFPQDIGRVLLNLYNNAFYAVTEKKKQHGDHYQPLVQVTTQKQNGKVEITVKDNGNGISQKVKDKIFQPFFTTKPTGQGTGLGLSLSYDIVKAHGGEIRVDTNEGEFTEFIIELPG